MNVSYICIERKETKQKTDTSDFVVKRDAHAHHTHEKSENIFKFTESTPLNGQLQLR